MVLKRILFYVLSFTWGALTSIVGAIVILFSLPFKRVRTYHGRLYAVWGKNWGGLELGCFFVCCENSSEHTLKHECGHGLQNCIWGPLYLVVIGIPSAARYWYRSIMRKISPNKKLPPYDSIWFEGQASRWGEKYIYNDLI